VLADLDLLATLPEREAACGWAEVRKAGVVGDEALLALLDDGVPHEEAARAEALQRAVAVKARLVERDERDQGPRRALNYGHTVGHALERLGLGLLHGEAVALGMLAAARLAVARGLVGSELVERETRALARLGLPVILPAALEIPALLALLGADKKRRSATRHTFVLPQRPRGVVVVEDVTAEEIVAAMQQG
jgi:3-dehydroquinate synthase